MRRDKHRFLRAVAAALEPEISKVYGERVGFALIVFRFNQPGVTDYISNGQRQDMITALREAANKLEAGQDIGPVVGSA